MNANVEVRKCCQRLLSHVYALRWKVQCVAPNQRLGNQKIRYPTEPGNGSINVMKRKPGGSGDREIDSQRNRGEG